MHLAFQVFLDLCELLLLWRDSGWLFRRTRPKGGTFAVPCALSSVHFFCSVFGRWV